MDGLHRFYTIHRTDAVSERSQGDGERDRSHSKQQTGKEPGYIGLVEQGAAAGTIVDATNLHRASVPKPGEHPARD